MRKYRERGGMRRVGRMVLAAVLCLVLPLAGRGGGGEPQRFLRMGAGSTRQAEDKIFIPSGYTLYFNSPSQATVTLRSQNTYLTFDANTAIEGEDCKIINNAGSSVTVKSVDLKGDCMIMSVYPLQAVNEGGSWGIRVEDGDLAVYYAEVTAKGGVTGISLHNAGLLLDEDAAVTAAGGTYGVQSTGVSAHAAPLVEVDGSSSLEGNGGEAGLFFAGSAVLKGNSSMTGVGGAAGIVAGGNLEVGGQLSASGTAEGLSVDGALTVSGTAEASGGVTGVKAGSVEVRSGGVLAVSGGDYGVDAAGDLLSLGRLEARGGKAATRAGGTQTVGGLLAEEYTESQSIGEEFALPAVSGNITDYRNYAWTVDGDGALELDGDGQGIRATASSSGTVMVTASRSNSVLGEGVVLASGGVHQVSFPAILRGPSGSGGGGTDPGGSGGNPGGGTDPGGSGGNSGGGTDPGGSGGNSGGGTDPGGSGGNPGGGTDPGGSGGNPGGGTDPDGDGNNPGSGTGPGDGTNSEGGGGNGTASGSEANSPAAGTSRGSTAGKTDAERLEAAKIYATEIAADYADGDFTVLDSPYVLLDLPRTGGK